MKSQSIPLIIYGASGYAKSLNKFILENGLRSDGYAVNRKYQNDDNLVFEQLDYRFEEYNILIGFSDYRTAEENIRVLKNVKNVYFLDTTLTVEFLDNKFVEENIAAFFNSYELLEDEVSKRTFLGYINGKLTLRCDDIYDLIDPAQYFVKDIVQLSQSEVFFDGGAYIGDTLQEFIKNTNGHYKKVFCAEPDISSYDSLVSNISSKAIKNVTAVNLGLWNEDTILKFSNDSFNAERSSLINGNTAEGVAIKVGKIDSILNGEAVTFIKLDIEGVEKQALEGARESIERFKPKLAICVYHRPEDLITIPQLIKSMRPDYKFYLRQHLHITQELVLYAI